MTDGSPRAGAASSAEGRRPADGLPVAGTVLGIDVGYSAVRATTGLCALSWSADRVWWDLELARLDRAHRVSCLARLVEAGRPVEAVAVDGPLGPELAHLDRYRAAEAVLSRGPLGKRGKPGATSSPGGQRLHVAATELARLAVEQLDVRCLPRAGSVLRPTVVETFPGFVLGALCDEDGYPARPARARRWTDTLYPLVRPRLEGLVAALLPGRQFPAEPVTGHDRIAALACAVMALAVAAGVYLAVGAPRDGWIILPPEEHLGRGWWDTLQRALSAARATFPAAQVVTCSGPRP